MELPSSPSSHHFSARKPGEPGLAEWAKKIRALQRQVDADEEEEHRKLEQEINASRLARVRRSAGYSHASRNPAVVSPDIPSPISQRSSTFESEGTSTNIYHDRTETLQKPVGKPSPLPSASLPATTPMSLATFIGGRATGPRLNKHAPQQDITDPTLFEQRTTSSSSVPHPIFGRGGKAMPGLTSRGLRLESPISDHELHSPTLIASTGDHSPVTKNEPTSSNMEAVLKLANCHQQEGTPRQLCTNAPSAALKRYIQHVEQVTTPPLSRPSERDNSRPRTMSTPAGTNATRVTTLLPPGSQSHSRSVSPRPPISRRTPTSEVRQPLATFITESLPSKALAPSPSKPSSHAFTMTPKKSTVTNSSSLAFGVKLPTFSMSTPSLPRTESPTSKVTPLTPPPRTLHPPKEKDPTPSISRLKGRGFVQSMVKVSSALEAAAAGTSTCEAGRLEPNKRSSLVVDRWKPEQSPSSLQTATPPAGTLSGKKNVAQRKSWAASEPLKAEVMNVNDRFVHWNSKALAILLALSRLIQLVAPCVWESSLQVC
ncbi:hypothetical protein EI94DRAFT_681131 [Lactarius quietus]|nr:hypothetical protein EI94DRAFT_681131 [Lactarius quietus]